MATIELEADDYCEACWGAGFSRYALNQTFCDCVIVKHRKKARLFHEKHAHKWPQAASLTATKYCERCGASDRTTEGRMPCKRGK